MSDEPFTAPAHRPAPRQPKPGELLWEFGKDHSTWSCELRDHGNVVVEAQILCEGELISGRRFETRARATQWADEERTAIEKRGHVDTPTRLPVNLMDAAPLQRICGWCRMEIAPGTQPTTYGMCHRCFVQIEWTPDGTKKGGREGYG